MQWPEITALNALLQRLHQILASERRFTGDAAHELRTLIAALRAQLDAMRLAPDNGPGVPAAQCVTLGQRFNRLDQPEGSGVGLGLTSFYASPSNIAVAWYSGQDWMGVVWR